MQIQLELGPEFRKTLAELSSMGAALVTACSKGLEKGCQYTASYIAQNYLSGQSLKTRKGDLRRAMLGWLEEELHGVIGIRPDAAVSKYSWLLGDEQKTILPVRGKFLTIPIGENLTGAGVARFNSPRQVPDGFFKNSKGRLLFGIKHGKKGKFRPYFVLVKSVFVQGSGALYDGVSERLDSITGSMQDEVDKAVGD